MAKKTKRKTPQRSRAPPAEQQQSAVLGECRDRSAGMVESGQGGGGNVEGEVEHAAKCRHFSRGVNLEKLEERLRASSVSQFCLDCLKKQPKDGRRKQAVRKKSEEEVSLLFCLACAHVGCATSVAPAEGFIQLSHGHGHAVEHFRRNRHPFVLQCQDGISVWCLDCAASIVRQSSLVDGFSSLGARGKVLEKAVKLIQESWSDHGSCVPNGKEEEESERAVVSLPTQRRNGIARGLVNLGNTCFFNSVMQNLLAVRCMKDYFLDPVTTCEGPLTSALKRFFQDINTETCDNQEFSTTAKKRFTSYNPKGLFGALCAKSTRFSGYHQQDSHELLRCLLDGIHVEERACQQQDLKEKYNPSNSKTFVDNFFGGQFASTVTCCECGHSSSVLEPFLDISLPIPSPHGSSKTANNFKVANNVCSKREIKAKKALERKKRPSLLKASVERSFEMKNNTIDKTSGDKKKVNTSAVDDVSWLDYLGDDFVDVSPAPEDGELLQVVTTSQKDTSDGNEEAKGADVDSTIADHVGGENGVQEAVAALGGSAGNEDNGSSVVDSADTTVAGPLCGGGGVSNSSTEEASSSTNDSQDLQESLADNNASIPSVILLPYREGERSVQDGWEMVPPVSGPDEVDGIADLFFQEEETATAVVVAGCANAEGVEEVEEIEDIVEKSMTPKTLEGCLMAFTKLEVLSGENAWGCDNCMRIRGSNSSCDSSLSTENDTLDADDDPEDVVEDKASGATSPQAGPCSSVEGDKEADEKHTTRARNRKQVQKKSGKVLVKSKATKSLVIDKAPPVLTVHLKRFAQDMRGRLSKLTGHVAFDEILNLSPFLDASKEIRRPCIYRLIGVVEHSGTMRGGHYVAFVRGEEESCWYYISDSDVRRSTLEQVLRTEAYLLFYERV